MGIKEQLNKLKENWLILAIALVLVLVVFGGTNLIGSIGGSLSRSMYALDQSAVGGAGNMYASKESSSYLPVPSADFAPQVAERLITKTASISNEVQRGKFSESESSLMAIISSSGSYLLNQNSNKYGTGRNTYRQGSYEIKVDAKKYDAVIKQLKGIGEVTSFNENARDITGDYTNAKIEIDAEKARLSRYQDMYQEAKEVSDKLTLTDRIFDQERKIKYMEDSLNNMDQQVSYSTIYLTITEKQSQYANIVFVKFSELVSSLVRSFNNLTKLIFVLLPWALALWVIRLIFKLVKKKARK